MVVLSGFEDARDGLRRRELRQALYDAGHRMMSGVIVNLHGEEHIDRRRLENRLFRRDTFAWYEQEAMPQIMRAALSPAVAAGRGELLDIARRTMMRLSVEVAGVDLPDGSFDRFHDLMVTMSKAATVAHAVGDTKAIIDAGDAALAEFERDFYRGSLERRRDLVGQFEHRRLTTEELPKDVLTTLLLHRDELGLPDDVVLREIAFYPWVGSHSTSGQLVHAMHHMFEWIESHPDDRARLSTDDLLRQRFVHESMRLHPASPVAGREAVEAVQLRSGEHVEAGTAVTVDLHAANRDPEVFGDDVDTFNPFRERAPGAAPWGLSFGSGTHACLGRELAGGVDPDADAPEGSSQLFGAVSMMAGTMLNAGARPDPDDPPSLDANTTRIMWGRYPVVFGDG